MSLTMNDACVILALAQRNAIEARGSLMTARRRVASERMKTAGESSVSPAALDAHIARVEAMEQEATSDLRAASARFAALAAGRAAANDDAFLQSRAPQYVATDRKTALVNLLAHGPLSIGDMFEITRWPKEDVWDILNGLIAEGIVTYVNGNQTRNYRLATEQERKKFARRNDNSNA